MGTKVTFLAWSLVCRDMNRKEFAEYVQHRYNQDPNGRFDRFGKEFLKSDNFTIRII